VDDATLAHILGRGQTSSPTASGGNTTLPLVLGYFFSFNGRIRRSLYWICQIAGGVLSTAGFYALTAIALQSKGNLAVASVVLLLSLVLMVLAIWSGLAVTVKRWHDRDKSGWWLFIAFLPLVGAIWALIECGFLDGTAGSNRFGPSPKGDLSAVFE
jgi:uncharacterized membrane protein YhaH (DUF805 family)